MVYLSSMGPTAYTIYLDDLDIWKLIIQFRSALNRDLDVPYLFYE